MNLWKALWNLSFTGPDAVDVFGIAFGIFFLQVAVKYLTKLPVLGADTPDPVEQREAHFDCLRLGIDLGFLGLVSGIGVLQVAVSKLHGDPHAAVEHFEPMFIVVQFLLVLIATIFTAIFRSASTQFKRGTWIPVIPGLCAIYSAIALYKVIAQWL